MRRMRKSRMAITTGANEAGTADRTTATREEPAVNSAREEKGQARGQGQAQQPKPKAPRGTPKGAQSEEPPKGENGMNDRLNVVNDIANAHVKLAARRHDGMQVQEQHKDGPEH